MAKKRVSKKRGATKAGKRRGGRRRGTWEVVKEGSLQEFRKTQSFTRSKVAELLGVSQTTIQNWETGKAVPTRKSQAQLAELMNGAAPAAAPVAAPAPRGRGRAASNGIGSGHGAPMTTAHLTATSEIVKGFLATPSGGKVSSNELVALVQALRSVLA